MIVTRITLQNNFQMLKDKLEKQHVYHDRKVMSALLYGVRLYFITNKRLKDNQDVVVLIKC